MLLADIVRLAQQRSAYFCSMKQILFMAMCLLAIASTAVGQTSSNYPIFQFTGLNKAGDEYNDRFVRVKLLEGKNASLGMRATLFFSMYQYANEASKMAPAEQKKLNYVEIDRDISRFSGKAGDLVDNHAGVFLIKMPTAKPGTSGWQDCVVKIKRNGEVVEGIAITEKAANYIKEDGFLYLFLLIPKYDFKGNYDFVYEVELSELTSQKKWVWEVYKRNSNERMQYKPD
jgi:hypothetical protein